MNQVLEGMCANDIREIRESTGVSMQEAKLIATSDRIMSALHRAQLLIKADNLKEAIMLQNDIIRTMLMNK